MRYIPTVNLYSNSSKQKDRVRKLGHRKGYLNSGKVSMRHQDNFKRTKQDPRKIAQDCRKVKKGHRKKNNGWMILKKDLKILETRSSNILKKDLSRYLEKNN